MSKNQWWLYRKIDWVIVLITAAILGVALEFLLFKPQESSGPNVAEDSVGALIFFLIIWPILLVFPYGLFQLLSKLSARLNRPPGAKRAVTAIVVAAFIATIAFIEFKLRMLNIGV